MKKLMIVAAAAAMTVAANAASFTPVDCSGSITPSVDNCPYMVFKVTASGKSVEDVHGGEYKKVASLKVKKGALVFKYNVACATAAVDPVCCYDFANLYATVKIGSEETRIAVPDIVIDKWSVFGKDLEKAVNWDTQIKQGKKVKLESDLFLVGAGIAAPTLPAEPYLSVDEDGDTYLKNLELAASAFGKFEVRVNKASSRVNNGYCVVTTNSTACAATWTPKSYSGWFVGTRYLLDGDQACFNCACGAYEVFGGTWKATYVARWTTDAEAQHYAFGSQLFRGSVSDDGTYSSTIDDWTEDREDIIEEENPAE